VSATYQILVIKLECLYTVWRRTYIFEQEKPRMQKLKTTFLLFALLCFVSGCFQDYTIDNSDNTFPVRLSLDSVNDKLVKVSWEKTNISSFKRYIVVKSATAILTGLKPNLVNVNINPFTIIAEIYDFNENTWSDSAIFPSEKAYYKVYVELDNKIIESNNIEVDLNVYDLKGNITSLMLDKDSLRLIYNTNTALRNFSAFNINEKKVENKADNVNFFIGSNFKYAPVYLPVFKFYLMSGSSLGSVQYPSISFSQEQNVSASNIWSMSSSSKFLLINVTPQSFSSNKECVYIYSLGSTLEFKDSNLRTDPFEKRISSFIDDDTFVEAKFGNLSLYNLSIAGYETKTTSINVPDLKSLSDQLTLSSDKKYMIASKDGDIYRVSDFSKLFDNTCEDCVKFLFSKDGKLLYQTRKNSLNKLIVEVIDLNTMKQIDWIETEANDIVDIYNTRDNKLGMIMSNKFNQIFLKEISIN
jgi:hypothetical protein